MTDSKRQLPPVPNPDYLRKRAKVRLAALRMLAPSTRLAEAQHLIAREYRFANWAELQREVARRLESPAGRYAKVRRQPLAVPGRRHEEDDESLLNQFLVSTAAMAIIWVLAGVGVTAWLLAYRLSGPHDAFALLHKIL